MIARRSRNHTLIRLVLVIFLLFLSVYIGKLVVSQTAIAIQLSVVTLIVLPALILSLVGSCFTYHYIIATWILGPEIRRVTDWLIGSYHAVSIVSLVPLIATLTLLFDIRGKNFQISSGLYRTLVRLFLLLILYATLLGTALNHISALYVALQWCVPFLAFFHLARKNYDPANFDSVLRATATLAVLVSLYGWIQFLTAPPWDVLWMQGSQMGSIGQPLPLQIRVFSTLNSPGPAAVFLTMALLPMLIDRRWRGPFGTVGIVIIFSALALTLVRSSWIAMLIAIGAVMLVSKNRRRWRWLLSIAFVAIVLFEVIPHLPGASTVISRIQSFGHLSSDTSFNARITLLRIGVNGILHRPLGRGFGSIGHSTAVLNNGKFVDGLSTVDNGYLGVFAMFGWVVGCIFFILLTRMWKVAEGSTDYGVLLKGFLSLFLAGLVFGGQFDGLTALFIWMTTAITIRAHSAEQISAANVPTLSH